MLVDEHKVGTAQGPGSADEIQIAGSQELGPDYADETHPAEQQEEPEEPPEIGCDDAIRSILSFVFNKWLLKGV